MKIPLFIASDFSGVLDQLFLAACSYAAAPLALILFVQGVLRKSRSWTRSTAFFALGFTGLQLYVMICYIIEIPPDHQNKTVKQFWPVMAALVVGAAVFALWRVWRKVPPQPTPPSRRG